jgi:hypothetical protein
VVAGRARGRAAGAGPRRRRGANALAVEARQYFDAAAQESDPDKRIELLEQAKADLEAILSAYPKDAYAARFRTGEPVLGMTRAALDESIAAAIRAKGPQAAASAGRAGSYLILLDGQRKPLLAAYWIGDDVIGVVRGGPISALPESNQALVIDRYLFPRVAIDERLFLVERLEYEALPDSYAQPAPGTSFSVPGRLRPDALAAAQGSGKPFVVSFAWRDRLDRDVDGTPLEGYAFTASNLPDVEAAGLPIDRDAAARVYIPSLAFGVSRATWDRIGGVITGTAPSSADLAFAMWLQGDLPETMRSCLTDLRASDAYARYQEALAALERRNQSLIAQGLTDILAYGIAPYTELEKQYAIVRRFTACPSR